MKEVLIKIMIIVVIAMSLVGCQGIYRPYTPEGMTETDNF
jgi:hypothetical protein